MEDYLEQKIPELREKMTARLAELETLQEESAEARAPVELDQAAVGRVSRIDAIQAQQMAKETARRRTIEMQRIKSAFLRMDKGDYGICIRCEEDIAIKRLENDPSVPTCIDCAR